MSLERAFKLQAETEENPTLVGYQAVLAEEMSYIKDKRDRFLKAQEKKAALAERKRKLLEEKEMLMASRVLRKLTPEEQKEYNTKWDNLLKEYTKRKEILQHMISYSPSDFKVADIVAVAQWLDTWSTFLSDAETNIRSLKLLERSVSPETPVLPTQVLYDALDVVCRLQLQTRSLIGRERYRRAGLGDDAVQDFTDSQQQLMAWCRKQRETLEELNALEDLSAFSESFQKNVPVMDSNFLVLVDQSEPLADNPKVQSGLQELNEEWVQLCLMNYEKLQDAIRETHAASTLETNCAAWVNTVEPKAIDFMQSAVLFLKASDQSNPNVKNLLALCESFSKQHQAFNVIATHLSDFTIRDDCVRPHIDALKNELTTAFTSCVLGLIDTGDYEGRQEYRNRLEELREWVEVKSQKGTYLQLLGRLEDTKQMIQEYADALFPEETIPSEESSPIDLSYHEGEEDSIISSEKETSQQ